MSVPDDRPPPPPPPSASTEPRSEDPRWEEVRQLANLLDSRFRIPGTRQTFGIEPIIGIVPGVGDAVGLVASAYLVSRAVGLGARGWTLVSMLVTIVLDATVGSIPVAGTVFDVVYKANTRNVRLLEEHVTDPSAARARARRTVVRSLAAVVLVTLLVATLLVLAVVWIVRTLA